MTSPGVPGSARVALRAPRDCHVRGARGAADLLPCRRVGGWRSSVPTLRRPEALETRRVREGSWYRTTCRRHRRVPPAGVFRSCRRVFLPVRGSLFFACLLSAGLSGWRNVRVSVLGTLSAHFLAHLFGDLVPMSAHRAAIPLKTSCEPARQKRS